MKSETLRFDPCETLTLRLGPTSEQRYRAIVMWLSLADMWDVMGEPGKALYWRRLAEGAGWRPAFDLKKEEL